MNRGRAMVILIIVLLGGLLAGLFQDKQKGYQFTIPPGVASGDVCVAWKINTFGEEWKFIEVENDPDKMTSSYFQLGDEDDRILLIVNANAENADYLIQKYDGKRHKELGYLHMISNRYGFWKVQKVMATPFACETLRLRMAEVILPG